MSLHARSVRRRLRTVHAIAAALDRFRAEARTRLAYSDALYHRGDLTCVPACFRCCFLMLSDERFMDARNGGYRVEPSLQAEAMDPVA